MFRVFSRPVWQKNINWPNTYEPYARSMDDCRTIQKFKTRGEAIDYCDLKNKKWRGYHNAVHNYFATPTQMRMYYESNRYEWTEI